MNIDLIAGYITGKIDKKFKDKDNSHSGEIVIPVGFIEPYAIKAGKDVDIVELRDKVATDLPLIKGKVEYLLALQYSELYMLIRKFELDVQAHSPVNTNLHYLTIDYSIKSLEVKY